MASFRRLLPLSLCAGAICGLALLSSCSSSPAAAVFTPALSNIPVPTPGALVGPTPTNQWVVSWYSAPENAQAATDNAGSNEQTYRMLLVPSIDGKQERVHFSNYYGTAPVTIGAARLAVALSVNAQIDTTRDVPLTFGGSTSVTMAPGSSIVSEPVNIPYVYGERLAVSMYVKGTFGPLTQHSAQVSLNYQNTAGAGDATKDAMGTSLTGSTDEYFLLTGIDVYGPYQGSVAFFGSSSVDGHNSNFGSGNNYPTANVAVAGQDFDRPSDLLARSLLTAGYRLAAFNSGTVGDPAGEDVRTAAGYSEAGVDRMNRDVLSQAGIKAVVIYFGGVDIRLDCEPAGQVEVSLSNMVAQAQAAGVRVILGTIPPSEYCLSSDPSLLPSATNPYQGDLYGGGPENPGSTQRNLVNAWVRTTGAQLPGVVAIADFDKALLYPAHPDFFMPQFYSNDNFHPNAAGYAVQSNAVPLGQVLAH